MIFPVLKINFSPFPEIKTRRLVLRRVRMTDAPALFELRSSKVVLKYIDRPRHRSVKETKALIKLILGLEKKGSAVNWAITLKGDDILIGNICLWNIKKEHHRAELGYMLHPDHYGKGIMSEAIKAVLEVGFKKYKLHSVEAIVNPKNKVSIHLLEKNKFRREAYYKENYYFKGKFLDTGIYSKLTPYKK